MLTIGQVVNGAGRLVTPLTLAKTFAVPGLPAVMVI
jgi:hypothetical protein